MAIAVLLEAVQVAAAGSHHRTAACTAEVAADWLEHCHHTFPVAKGTVHNILQYTTQPYITTCSNIILYMDKSTCYDISSLPHKHSQLHKRYITHLLLEAMYVVVYVCTYIQYVCT